MREVFANVESYKYAARQGARALLFGSGCRRKDGAGGDEARRTCSTWVCYAPAIPTTASRCWRASRLSGVDLMLCFMEMGRVPHAKATMESIRLFGKYVIPHFKGRSDWRPNRSRTQASEPV